MFIPAPETIPPPDADAIRSAVAHALSRHRETAGNLLPILHAIQDSLGYIPPASVEQLASGLNRSRAEIHGVIRFYAYFRQDPPAPFKLEVCRAEACQAMGGRALAEHAMQAVGCEFSGRSADGRIELAPVYCLGLCAQSPVIALNERPYARMTPARLDMLLEQIPVVDAPHAPGTP